MRHTGLTALLVWLSLTGSAVATPLKPDLQKILKQSGRRLTHFEPARAGWDGPEVSQTPAMSAGQFDVPYGPAVSDRSIRASLTAAAIPDPKAVLAIGGLIVLLRILRQKKEEQEKEQRDRLAAITTSTEATDSPKAA